MITINNVYLPLKNPVYSKDDINIYPSEITCISGVSGSGKTTLLYLLALISDYGQCNYAFEDIYLNLKDEKQKADIRKCWIGNVFQENNLLNHLTINENFKIAAKMSGLELSDKDIRQLLDDLQLFDKTGNEYPHELSGGQKQRVAIGVALVKKPKLLIMDEPTSALDSENTKKLMKLISDLCKSRDLMVVLASHDRYVKESADRIYEIKNALIQCVKGDSKIAKGNFPSKFRKSTFSKIAYIRQYYHKFKRTKFILSVLCSIPITFFVLSTVLSNQIVQKQDELISNMTNNEIIVTNHWMQPYYNQDADVLDLELIEKVKQLDEVEYVMPFYVTETFIDGQSVVIQPYNELMNIEQFKDTNNHYVSYVLGEYLNIQSYPIEIETEYGLVQIDGVLESVQENKYYANSYVIYMPFEDFINICPITETSMILVYAKTYSLVYELHDVLRGIFPMAKLECDYINLTSIYESTQVTTMYLKLVSIALYSIVLLMLIIIYSRYIINREYEFCILRTNGLEAREISQIVFIDLVFQSTLFFIFSNFFTFLICLLLKGLNIIDYIQYFPLVVSLFIMSVIILIIPAIISIKRINQFSPAQFLRK